MKNIKKLFLATAIMMIFAVQANAQSNATADQPAQKQNTTKSTGGNFVDKDNNGICDNFESRQGKGRGSNFVDKDNNGICDNFESRSGKGRGGNFVDKNNDGICDNRDNAGTKSANQCRNGQGNQYRHGNGQGRGHGNCCRR